MQYLSVALPLEVILPRSGEENTPDRYSLPECLLSLNTGELHEYTCFPNLRFSGNHRILGIIFGDFFGVYPTRESFRITHHLLLVENRFIASYLYFMWDLCEASTRKFSKGAGSSPDYVPNANLCK